MWAPTQSSNAHIQHSRVLVTTNKIRFSVHYCKHACILARKRRKTRHDMRRQRRPRIRETTKWTTTDQAEAAARRGSVPVLRPARVRTSKPMTVFLPELPLHHRLKLLAVTGRSTRCKALVEGSDSRPARQAANRTGTASPDQEHGLIGRLGSRLSASVELYEGGERRAAAPQSEAAMVALSAALTAAPAVSRCLPGHPDRPRTPLRALRPQRLPLLAVRRRPDRGAAGRRVRPLHRHLLCPRRPDRHRAHGCHLRGARQRHVRPVGRRKARVRVRPRQSNARLACP